MDAAVALKVQCSSISYPQMVFQDPYDRSYLWSFRGKTIISRLVLGFVDRHAAIVGLQMLVVFLLAILLRANLPVIVALQWISNPLTMGPIYFADYQIGMTFLDFGWSGLPAKQIAQAANYDWSDFNFSDLLALVDTLPPMMIGGSIIGIFLGVVAVFLYKLSANLYNKSQDEPSSDS